MPSFPLDAFAPDITCVEARTWNPIGAQRSTGRGSRVKACRRRARACWEQPGSSFCARPGARPCAWGVPPPRAHDAHGDGTQTCSGLAADSGGQRSCPCVPNRIAEAMMRWSEHELPSNSVPKGQRAGGQRSVSILHSRSIALPSPAGWKIAGATLQERDRPCPRSQIQTGVKSQPSDLRRFARTTRTNPARVISKLSRNPAACSVSSARRIVFLASRNRSLRLAAS